AGARMVSLPGGTPVERSRPLARAAAGTGLPVGAFASAECRRARGGAGYPEPADRAAGRKAGAQRKSSGAGQSAGRNGTGARGGADGFLPRAAELQRVSIRELAVLGRTGLLACH